jgi:hypothetical protein
MQGPAIRQTTPYGTFRAKLLTRIFAGKPTPNQVADVLDKHRIKYREISQLEIDRYRLWGEHWPTGDTPSTDTPTPHIASPAAWEASHTPRKLAPDPLAQAPAPDASPAPPESAPGSSDEPPPSLQAVLSAEEWQQVKDFRLESANPPF